MTEAAMKETDALNAELDSMKKETDALNAALDSAKAGGDEARRELEDKLRAAAADADAARRSSRRPG